MLEHLTNRESIEDARRRINALLDARGEWLLTEEYLRLSSRTAAGESGAAARSLALRGGDWDVRVAHRGLMLSLWTERGARTWRVAAWELVSGERLVFEATRAAGAVRARLELVPRASAGAAKAHLAAARQTACEKLASLVAQAWAGAAKVERATLSRGARRGEPGRYARILLAKNRERLAATGAVVELRGANDVDSFLASALLWFARLAEKGSGRGGARSCRLLWLVVSREICAATVERVALLRGELRRVISVYELDEEDEVSLRGDEAREVVGTSAAGESASRVGERRTLAEEQRSFATERRTLARVDVPELDELLDAAPPRFYRPAASGLSRTASEIVALAPEAVDVVRARHGETLRYHGLAFARVRSLMNRERVWFGVEGVSPRRLLDGEESVEQLAKLIDELRAQRRVEAFDARHALYRAAPEAWLESLLRRDITRLDPGLRLAPLHAQFRTSRGASGGGGRPVDLLALRRDGRLVVVELKVSEDAALPLQGADYWRRIATHHRAGHIKHARLFGDAEISDEPPLVYLVAPLLRFHRSFETLARSVTPEIEMYRFDLNEDWRAGVRVARRSRIM